MNTEARAKREAEKIARLDNTQHAAYLHAKDVAAELVRVMQVHAGSVEVGTSRFYPGGWQHLLIQMPRRVNGQRILIELSPIISRKSRGYAGKLRMRIEVEALAYKKTIREGARGFAFYKIADLLIEVADRRREDKARAAAYHQQNIENSSAAALLRGELPRVDGLMIAGTRGSNPANGTHINVAFKRALPADKAREVARAIAEIMAR